MMRSVVWAALLLTVPVQAGAQAETNAQREFPWIALSGTLGQCAMSVQNGEPILSATIITGGGPGGGPNVKRESSTPQTSDIVNGGVDFSWGASNSGSVITKGGAGGIVPTVTAHAINTKGAGAQDRVSDQVCAAPGSQRLLLPAVQRRDARPVATCAVSGDPAMPTFTVHIPLSSFGPNATRSRIELIIVGKDSSGEAPARARQGWSIVQCDWSSIAKVTPLKAMYDIKVSKPI